MCGDLPRRTYAEVPIIECGVNSGGLRTSKEMSEEDGLLSSQCLQVKRTIEGMDLKCFPVGTPDAFDSIYGSELPHF